MLKNLFFKPPAFSMDVSLETIFQGQFKTTYRGVPAWRCPFDYVIYQMILSEVKPDLIIEIGTNQGGGAYYLADLLLLLGGGKVHTIDITNNAQADAANHPSIKFFHAGWQEYDIDKETAGFKRILVIDDGSHTYADTLGALKKFSRLVGVGSYFIVEDGIITDLGYRKIESAEKMKKYEGGPIRAIDEFLATDKTFSIDDKWTNMFGKNATFNVNGYLKKTA